MEDNKEWKLGHPTEIDGGKFSKVKEEIGLTEVRICMEAEERQNYTNRTAVTRVVLYPVLGTTGATQGTCNNNALEEVFR